MVKDVHHDSQNGLKSWPLYNLGHILLYSAIDYLCQN